MNRKTLLETAAVVAFAYAMIMTGIAIGQVKYIDYMQGEVDVLQDAVIDQDERIASLTTSLDYQEATDGKRELIAKYIRSRNRSIGDRYAGLLADTLIAAGGEFNFDPLFLAAQAGVESAFNTHDKSSAGAIGIMQVMPFWVDKIPFLESRDDLLNIHANIRAGVYILGHYRSMCGGALHQALTCYHGGPRALKLPRSSTTAYVSRVLARWQTLELM